MAQTGYTPILIYSSSTASQAPSAGNLNNSTLGSELAINITDGKLFYKDNGGSVQVIGWKTVPTSAGGTGLTSYTAGDMLYYASGTALSKLAIGTAYQALQVNAGATAPSWQPSATSVLTTQGDLLYASAANTLARLAKNTTASRYLSNSGTSNNPAWAQVDLTNGVTGVLPVANGGTNASSASITAFNNITGYTSSGATGTTSTNLVFSTSPTITTPSITGDLTMSTGNVVQGTAATGFNFTANTGASGKTSQLLSWYEEGTWTPIDGSGAGLSFSGATGYYTRIGRAVTVTFNVAYPTTANANAARIGGLPFTSANTSSGMSNGCFNINNSGVNVQPSIVLNDTNFAALQVATGTSATNAQLTGATLRGGLTYFV